MKRIVLVEELIIDLYVNQGLSTTKIADQVGCTYPTIVKVLKKRNVYSPQKPLGLDKDQIHDLFVDHGVPIKKIAEQFGCSTRRIGAILHEKGIDLTGKPKKIELDDDEVTNLYTVQCLSVEKIAEHYGCSAPVISRRLKKLGIDTTWKKDVSSEEVVSLHSKGLSTAKIANHFNCSTDAIRCRLHQEGVDISQTKHDLDMNEVIDLYVNQGLSLKKIADRYGCNSATIRNKLLAQGVDTSQKVLCLDVDEIKRLYQDEGLTVREISNLFNVCDESIKKRLLQVGIDPSIVRPVVDGQEVLGLYASQRLTVKEIAHKIGVGQSQITKIIKANNIELVNHLVTLDSGIVKSLYVDQGLSIMEIQSKLGCSRDPVRRALQQAGVDTSRKMDLDLDLLRELYEEKHWTMKMIGDEFNVNEETIRNRLHEMQVNTNISQMTFIEHFVKSILDEYRIDYVTNDRKVLMGEGNGYVNKSGTKVDTGLELDFYIPTLKVAIEIHGLYWHSVHGGGKSVDYHMQKYKACERKGINLLQLWQDQIIEVPEIVRSVILRWIGESASKIHASDCDLVEVPFEIGSVFLKENHLYGECTESTQFIALDYDGTIVAMLGVETTSDARIITHYCVKNDTIVIHGIQMLVGAVPKDLPLLTMSYNDIDKKSLYLSNNFKVLSDRQHMKVTDYTRTYDRLQFRKSKMAEIFGPDGFDHNRFDLENLVANGFDQIYTAGTKTWIYQK